MRTQRVDELVSYGYLLYRKWWDVKDK